MASQGNFAVGVRRARGRTTVTFAPIADFRRSFRAPAQRGPGESFLHLQCLYTAITSGVLTPPRATISPIHGCGRESARFSRKDPRIPTWERTRRVSGLRFDIEIPTCREGVFVPCGFAAPDDVIECVRLAERPRLRGGLGHRLPDAHSGERGKRGGAPELVRADDYPGLRRRGDQPDQARHRDHHPPLSRSGDPRQAGGDARPAVEGPVPARARPGGVARRVPGGRGVARARASGQHGGGVHRGSAAVARPRRGPGDVRRGVCRHP